MTIPDANMPASRRSVATFLCRMPLQELPGHLICIRSAIRGGRYLSKLEITFPMNSSVVLEIPLATITHLSESLLPECGLASA